MSVAGDHIRVVHAVYHHHMLVTEVYKPDGKLKVIHFSSGRSDSRLSSKLASARIVEEYYIIKPGTELEVLTYKLPRKQLYTTDEAIERARNRLGENDYNAFFYNCESFVNWALTGEEKSQQGTRAAAGTIVGSIATAGGVGAGVGGAIGSALGPVGTVAGGAIGGLIGVVGSSVVSLTGVLITIFKRR